ncbi:MAG: patatin-like phospholipase family protein, partial [Bacteroidota bacterium]|nr:patatin-like phospholipase family protein [Bacteroidota bacterium]
MAKRQIKYALVLSGGGFLGAYEVGALNYINQHWTQITGLDEPMVFDIVSGISVGSLNGVMAAQGKMNELNELWSLVAEHGGSEIFTSDYIDERGNFKLNFEALKKDLFPGFTVQTRYFFRGIWNVFMKLFGKDLPSFFELIIR